MRTVRWEAEARLQYRDTLTYIALHDVVSADRLRTVIDAKIDLLIQFAEIGRPGRVQRTRELIVHPNYIVIYAIRRNTIDIIRFLHARQQYP